MDKKTIASFARRMKKANSSFGCMGSMILDMEIEAMDHRTRVILRDALAALKVPVKYDFLESRILKSAI